jgi:peroxiredoxin Q/BCP
MPLPKVGDPAPDFRVKDDAGRERTLREFRGRRVVVWFYPRADTPG